MSIEYVAESSVAETRPSNESLSADDANAHNLLCNESPEPRNFVDNDEFSTISFESTGKNSSKGSMGEPLIETGSNDEFCLSLSADEDIFEPESEKIGGDQPAQQNEEKPIECIAERVPLPISGDRVECSGGDGPQAVQEVQIPDIQGEPTEANQLSIKSSTQEPPAEEPLSDPQFNSDALLSRIAYLESEQKKSKKACSMLTQRVKTLERELKKITPKKRPASVPQETAKIVTPMKSEQKQKSGLKAHSPSPFKRSREITDRKSEKTPHRGKEKKPTREFNEAADKTVWKSVDRAKSLPMPADQKVVLLYHGRISTEDVRTLNAKVESLNGEVSDTTEAPHTHLVSNTEECGRYLKTLIALIQGIPIVTKEWINQSSTRGEWLETLPFLCPDVPHQLFPRRGLLPEFRNATVGILGDTKPAVADFKQIISALGGEGREITTATRRHMEGVKIIIVPANTSTESFAAEIRKMPELHSIFTDENLKEVIWEGERRRIRNLLETSGNEAPVRPPNCPMPYLEEIPDSTHQGSDPRRIYPVTSTEPHALIDGKFPPFLVGRSGKCQYCLPYEGISRVHFALDVLQDGDHLALFLEDKGSTNGLFINQRKREKRTMVHEGDIILIGGGAGVDDGACIDESMEIDYSAKFVVRYGDILVY